MKGSVALSTRVHGELTRHLARDDGQEDLCFALWYPSRGASRETALVTEVVLPATGERYVHEKASFEPEFFARALQQALERGAGLAFLHSHRGTGWQEMSRDDVRAEEGMAGAVASATGLSLVGMTLGAADSTWSARFWRRKGTGHWEPAWCENVRVVGESLQVSYCDELLPPPKVTASQVRTVSAWGPERQAHLARLRVGVVGLGSVGMLVAEGLARTGVVRLRGFDFDSVEEVNRDRGLYATEENVGQAKVHVAAERLRQSATAEQFSFEAFEHSICEPEGYRLALDCDVLFSCVDRPWPRSVLNFIAYAHLIPVIDGGIKVSRTGLGRLRSADWKAHVATHDHRCLCCFGQYDPALSTAERDGYLDDPSYIEALSDDDPLKARQNVFIFSMSDAALELSQFLMLVVSPSGVGAAFGQNYHLVTGDVDRDSSPCEDGCVFPKLEGLGDSEGAGHSGTGEHAVARQAREARRSSRRKEARSGNF